MTQTAPEATPHERLVRHLSRLDRGQLAQLRRSLGDDRPGQSVPWLAGVFLRSGLGTPGAGQWQALALVAGLYALVERPDDTTETEAPAPERRESFGQTFGGLYLAQDQRPSTEKRFLALLDADTDALPYALRQAVTLLHAGDHTPDWVQLLRDVNLWDHDEYGDEVRRRWARDFYRRAERLPDTDPAETSAQSDTPASNLPPRPDPTLPDEDEGDDTL
ncbi:type I-E CRISPR-associated protein Cse2/CasB [uncultured Deinococcus sp.]|uniref:type I-E CRISPR-associated protein Cse2/CasB n=1 Tax=uncultured Deinococcus sp. TaxID=158789 RepID=UPI0037484C3C